MFAQILHISFVNPGNNEALHCRLLTCRGSVCHSHERWKSIQQQVMILLLIYIFCRTTMKNSKFNRVASSWIYRLANSIASSARKTRRRVTSKTKTNDMREGPFIQRDTTYLCVAIFVPFK